MKSIRKIVSICFALSLCATPAGYSQGAVQGQTIGTGLARTTETRRAAPLIPAQFISNHPRSLQFLPEAGLPSGDAEALQRAWPIVQRDASDEGFNLLQQSWTYQEAICPDFSRHILLLFSEDAGGSAVNMFTALLSRDEPASVRILPLLFRGGRPSSGRRGNPVAIAAFNWLRTHEAPIMHPDMVTLGMCYAALTGAHVVLPGEASNGGVQMPWSLQINEKGASLLRFQDIESATKPQLWELSFDRDGELREASVIRVRGEKETSLRAQPVKTKTIRKFQ